MMLYGKSYRLHGSTSQGKPVDIRFNQTTNDKVRLITEFGEIGYFKSDELLNLVLGMNTTEDDLENDAD